MTSKKSMLTIRPLSEWQVQLLRLTAFYSPNEEFDISQWWTAITGEPPEKTTANTRENTFVSEGPLKDGKLTLIKSPIVIELRLHLTDTTPNEVCGVPTLGTLDNLHKEFFETGKKLLKVSGFPSIRRIAFGSIVNLPMEDHLKAYKQLAHYIKCVKLDPVNSSDFFYQINRRRKSKVRVKNLLINRLSKWSVASFQTILSPLSAGVQAISTRSNYACRLELDVNTCQEYESCLPKVKISQIFKELVDMGVEIVNRGDIA